MVLRHHEADEDEASSESANDHFHKIGSLNLVEITRQQRPNDHPVKAADNRVARQRTSSSRTAHEFIIGKAQTAADDSTNNNA